MSGYQVTCGGEGFHAAQIIPPRIPVGLAPECRFRADRLSAFTWGAAAGDVFVSSKPGQSCLILNGWVGPSEGVSPEDSEQKLCESLHARLERAPSKLQELRDLARNLQGSFSLVYASLATGEAFVVTDRISSHPVWVARVGDNWLLCSHATPLARLARSGFDLGALASFLLYGCQVDPHQSIYRRVRASEEGSILHLTADGTAKTTKWYTFRHQPDESRSPDEWLDLAAERMKNSARAILATCFRPMVFLSGGLDSRLTAAALCAVGAEPHLVTLGDSVNLEIRTAQAVARAVGCPHKTILRDPHWYLRGIPRAVFESSGAFDWSHAHFAEAYRSVQSELGVDAAMLGDFGEAFSKLLCSVGKDRSLLWSVDEFLQEFDQLPLPSYRPRDRKRTLSLLQGEARARAENELERSISDRYSAARSVAEDARIVGDYFFRWQTANCAPTFEMVLDLRSAGPERTLMHAPCAYQLLEEMPAHLRDQANFGARLIRRLHPKAAWVANSNTLLPPCTPPALQALVGQVRPILGKIKRRFVTNTYRTTDSWSFKPLLYLNDNSWKSFIQETILHGRLQQTDLFDPQAILQTVADFYAGNMALSIDIERLVSLAIHLDLMVDGPTQSASTSSGPARLALN